MVNNYPKSIKFTTLRIALLVALTSIFSFSMSQTVIEVPNGNPNGGTGRKPLGAYFGYERAIMVYDKVEINGGAGLPAGSSITRLEFFYESTDGCPIGLDYNVKIYLEEVAAASLVSQSFPTAVVGSQLVFDGTMVTSTWNTAGVWVAIDLQNCFIFQNNNNSLQVMVETNFGDPPANDANGWFSQPQPPFSCGGGSNAIMFRANNTANSNFMQWSQDGTPPTASGFPTTTGRPNIRMTYSPAPNCTALPPMTPQTSMSPVCSGNIFTLILPTLPCVAGLTFQWQYSITGSGGPYSNIGGATMNSLTTSQSQQTWYRCTVGCTFSASFINTFSVQVDQNSYLGCYCASSPTFSNDTDIGNVTMTRISNGSVIINNPPGGCTPTMNNANASGTYSNFTGLGPYNLVQGENYGMNMCQITSGGTFFSAFFNVFIDWNADGAFSLTNERVMSGGPTSQATPTASGTVLIPFSSDTGITRMRVQLREGGSAGDPACGGFGWGEVEDYNVNILPGLICNLTTPGNAVSSFPTVCTNQIFTLSITGNATVGSFQTWQWQSSPTAVGPWGNIIGATFTPYNTSQTADTWYRCVLICNGGTAQLTGVVSVPMASPTQCYCTPVHPAGCATNFISNVVFNTLTNPTGCTSGNGPSYTQYPVSGSTTTTVTQGNTHNLSITTAGSGNAIISVWIDWNRNGIFESTEHFQPSINNPVGSTAPAIPVTIPLTSGTGLTGLRVRSRASGNPNGPPDACTVFGSGEAEDYFITIIPFTPPNCTLPAPNLQPTSTTQSSPCSGTNFTLTLNTPLFSGMQYQWQASTNGGVTWNNVSGATGISHTGNQTLTTCYRNIYECTSQPGAATSLSTCVTNTANYWRGVNSDWSDAVNWCSGTPRLVDDVLISRTQPGVANPYYTPIVAVSDTVLSKNLTIALNDSITFYNDTLNAVNIAQSVTVNGKFIMRSSISDTCCLDTYNGTTIGGSFQPFRTNIAENRLQMIFIPNDFASLPNLSTSDQVTYLLFQFSSWPNIVAPSGSFQNFKVSYGWVPPTTLAFPSTDPFPTPNTVATFASLNLAGKTITPPNDTLMIAVTNFKWRTDSNLVLQFCYDTPNGQNAAGGVPSWQVKVKNTPGRRSGLFASVTSPLGLQDGCALVPTTPGVATAFGEFHPNIKFIFGRKPKKLTIPIGNDLIVNSTGTFQSALANVTVADSLNNQGVFSIDSTAVTVTNLLLNTGTFDMTYAYGGTNEFNSLSVGGQGLINNGTFIAGKSPITVTGTTFDNASGTFDAGTSLFTMTGANFNNNATYNTGTSTLYMNSAATQSIGGTSPLTLYRLRLSKGLNSTLVNLNNTAVTVTDSINLLKGSIDLNGKTLTFTNPAVLTFRQAPLTAGYIISAAVDFTSKLKWTIGTTAGNHIFPFYKLPLAPTESNGYIPVEFNNVAGINDNVGDVTIATYPTAATNTPLPPNVWHINNGTGVNNTANMANRYWYLERSNPVGAVPNTALAFTVVNAEKKAATVFGNMRMQPYYTYTVASPPPLTRAAWLAPPGTQLTTTGGLGTPFRTAITAFNWPASVGLSGPWANATSTTPLPIELLQFDASLAGNISAPYVDVNWATASEQENDFFTVERTLDFKYITEIDRVPSQGNSSMIQKYYTVDDYPIMGKVNYYRLKQTDLNGATSFNDKWVAVNVGLKEVFNINYVKHMSKLEVVFEYDSESNIDVVIRDMTGRVMYSSTGFGATPGLNVLTIDAAGWADGAYLITLSDNERQVSHKIFY